jgi:hypothetical protein
MDSDQRPPRFVLLALGRIVHFFGRFGFVPIRRALLETSRDFWRRRSGRRLLDGRSTRDVDVREMHVVRGGVFLGTRLQHQRPGHG